MPLKQLQLQIIPWFTNPLKSAQMLQTWWLYAVTNSYFLWWCVWFDTLFLSARLQTRPCDAHPDRPGGDWGEHRVPAGPNGSGPVQRSWRRAFQSTETSLLRGRAQTAAHDQESQESVCSRRREGETQFNHLECALQKQNDRRTCLNTQA